MKKWTLSRRDSIDMLKKIEGSLGLSLDLSKSAQVMCAEPEDGMVFVQVDSYEFVQSGDLMFPYVGSQATTGLFPTAVVDEGAIRFLLNGADVMRPGIRKLDEWGEKGRMVVVKEEKKGRTVAVGPSAVASTEAQTMTKGVCIKNLHHAGDRYWTAHKAL